MGLVVARETVFCCVVLRLFFCADVLVFARFVDDDTERVADDVFEDVVVVDEATERLLVCVLETETELALFDAARAVSDASANVVWDTDKPRHTAKNSIILFIP